MKNGPRTGSAGIFPFRLRRQPVRQTFLFTEPPAKSFCVVPAHEDNGLMVLDGKAKLAPHKAVRRIELLEPGISDFVRADIERVAYSHFVGGPFISITISHETLICQSGGQFDFIPSELVNDWLVGIGAAADTDASTHIAAAIKLSPMIFSKSILALSHSLFGMVWYFMPFS
jgi:hypothetical protein